MVNKASLLFKSLVVWVSICTHAHAQSGVTIYGMVDAGILVNNSGKGTTIRQDSGQQSGSRLGFRGSEDLGDGWRANFNLQMGYFLDTGALAQGGRAFGRQSSVGISNPTFGTLELGRIPEPYFYALGAVDAYRGGQPGGFLAITRSTATSTQQLLPLYISARMDNSVKYVSPSFDGLQVQLQGALGEGSATIGRGYGASVNYTKGPWDAWLALVRQTGASSSAGRDFGQVIGANYDFGVAVLFAAYARENNNCSTCGTRASGVQGRSSSEFRYISTGVRVPFGTWVAVSQVIHIEDRSEYAAPVGDRDATVLSAGLEYYFSKRTMLYGSFGTIGNRNGSNYALGASAVQLPPNSIGAADSRSTTFSFGVNSTF